MRGFNHYKWRNAEGINLSTVPVGSAEEGAMKKIPKNKKEEKSKRGKGIMSTFKNRKRILALILITAFALSSGSILLAFHNQQAVQYNSLTNTLTQTYFQNSLKNMKGLNALVENAVNKETNTMQQFPNDPTEAPIITVGTDYYLPFSDNTFRGPNNFGSYIWMFSAQDTQVKIDLDNDGNFDYVLNLVANQPVTFSNPLSGTRIVSDKPVAVFYHIYSEDYSIYDSVILSYEALPTNVLGMDYYLPSNCMALYIVSTTPSTNIQIDTNNDGFPEMTWANQGIGAALNYQNPPAGTHITSNNPIGVVAVSMNWANRDNTFSYAVLPTNRLGTDYWFNLDISLRYVDATDYSGFRIVATQDNTLINIDGNNYALNEGGTLPYQTGTSFSSHITSDKPIGVVYLLDIYARDIWAGVYRHYTFSQLLEPTSQLGTSYQKAYTIGATHDNTEIKIDINYDGVFEYTVYLNAGQTFNPLTEYKIQTNPKTTWLRMK